MKAILKFAGSNFVTGGRTFEELCIDVRLCLSSLVPLPEGALRFACQLPVSLSEMREHFISVKRRTVYIDSEVSFIHACSLAPQRPGSADDAPLMLELLLNAEVTAEEQKKSDRELASHPRTESTRSPTPLVPEERESNSKQLAGTNSSSASCENAYPREPSGCIHAGMPGEMVDATPLSREAVLGLEVKSYAEYLKVLQELEPSERKKDVPSTRMRLHTASTVDKLINSKPSHHYTPHAATKGASTRFHSDLLSSKESNLLSRLLDARDMHVSAPPGESASTSHSSSHTSGGKSFPLKGTAHPLRPCSSPPTQVNNASGFQIPRQRPASVLAGASNKNEMRSQSRCASEEYHQLFSRPSVSSVYEQMLETVENESPQAQPPTTDTV